MNICEGYQVTFRLIGDSILLTIPNGTADTVALNKLYDLRDQVLADCGLEDGPFVEIKDYSEIKVSPNHKIRALQVQKFREDSHRMVAFCSFNSSLIIRALFSMGRRLHQADFPMGQKKDYAAAVSYAQGVLQRKSLCKTLRRDAEARWLLDGEDFSASFEFPARDLFYVTVSGEVSEQAVQSIARTQEFLLETHFKEKQPGGYIRVLDLLDLDYGNYAARKRGVKETDRLHHRFPCSLGLVVYRGFLGKLVMWLGNKTLDYPLCSVSSRAEAMKFISQFREGKKASKKEKDADEVIQMKRSDLNSVLNMLGKISWNSTGESLRVDHLDEGHPLCGIIDAFRILRCDYESSLKNLQRMGKESCALSGRLEESLLELEQQSRKAEVAAQAKDEFLLILGHELRTPLNGIAGMFEMLETDHLSFEDLELIDLGKRSSRKLLDLVAVMLEYVQALSRSPEEYEKKQVDLTDFLEETLQQHAEENAGCFSMLCEKMSETGTPTEAIFARETVEKILFQLLSNAIKFNTGHKIVLRVSGGNRAPLCFEVEDDGTGIPDQEKNTIFDRFYQSDAGLSRSHGGTGMGLAMAKALAESMNAKLAVEDAPSGGALFRLTLKG